MMWSLGPVIFFMVLMASGMYLFVSEANEQVNVEFVDCFDKYGNKILGQVCEDESRPYSELAFVMIMLGMFGSIFSVSFIQGGF